MADDLKQTAKALFESLDGERSSTIDRAVLSSELTVPYVFREESATDSDDLSRERVQGFGAKLVNHLVGKFALSILPPSQPFYRLSPTQEALDAVTDGDEEAIIEIEKILATKEDSILRFINKSKFRGSLYPAIRTAMITGDALIEKLEVGYKVFNMRNYVIKRDSSGNIQDLIIKELIQYDSLPEEIKSSAEDTEDDIEVYTRVYNDETGKYNQLTEINEEVVSGSEEQYDSLDERFISVRWNKIDGEDYGRSFVEEHLGTLIELNKHLGIISEAAAISGRIIHTVNPNGMTKYKDFVEAENGDTIIGNEQDIGSISSDKRADLQVSYQLVQDFKRELSEAFLMSSASIRDAERVTAHEVQMVASELEASFGGIYTAIAEDIQMPVIKNAMSNINLKDSEDIDVFIVAGVEALGRNVELSKINGLMQELGQLSQLVGAEQIAMALNTNALVSAIIANSGVASKGFVKSQATQNQDVADSKKEEIARMGLESGMSQVGQNMANQI
ncbi:MAG: portal protein [Poseidonibacter sp.]